MAGACVTANDTNFKAEVIDSTVPVLVDFWAPWCGPCRAISPHVEALSTEWAGKVKVVKVDCGINPKAAARFKVTTLPTFVLFKGGKEVARMIGVAQGLPGLKKTVQPHLA